MSQPDIIQPSTPPEYVVTHYIHCPDRCECKIYGAADSLESLSTIRNYYRILFALIRGSENRPILPVELAVRICQYANFLSPSINKSLSDHLRCPLRLPSPKIQYCINAALPPPTINKVLRTKRISQSELQVLGAIEILAELKDDSGWAGPDDWEKFFIKIHPQGGWSNARAESDAYGMVWPCFESEDSSPDNQGSDQSTEPKWRRVIDRSHEIWDFFQPGDQFEVALKGQKWNSARGVFEVVVCVRNQWEPSPAMLAFA